MLADKLNKVVDSGKAIILQLGGQRYVVVAAAIQIDQSFVEIFESPFK
jgi:hypothetical protein